MKQSLFLSLLFCTTSAGFLPMGASLAQTVPIISGTINFSVSSVCGTCLSGFAPSNVNFLTPLGIVNFNSDTFNGKLTFLDSQTPNLIFTDTANNQLDEVSVGSSQFGLIGKIIEDGLFAFRFVGTTNGTSPTGQFTNAPTTINFSVETSVGFGFNFVPLPVNGIYSAEVTLGSTITLPLTADSLPVRPDLIISFAALRSSDFQKPESQRQCGQDFSTSSFSCGRILDIEDK